MKSSTRWLIGFGVIIGIIVIATVVLVLIMPGEGDTPLLPEDTPEGTVQRYLRAVQTQDYEEAYGYLSQEALEERYDDPFEWFDRQSYALERSDNGWKATLGEPSIVGNRASIRVKIETFEPSFPLSNPLHSRNYTFRLQRYGDDWLITEPLYLWIFY
jgi:hypothetical protein